MNKGDFYKKINDLYDKGTYLEKYGLQAILAAVIIILVFSAISYITLRKNESEIVHNWGRGNVKTENGEWKMSLLQRVSKNILFFLEKSFCV